MMRASYWAWSIFTLCFAAARVSAQAEPATVPAAPVAAESAATTTSSAATPPAASNPYTGRGPSVESLRLARERWPLQILQARARARAERDMLAAQSPSPAGSKPAAPQKHGDAGAAIAIGVSVEALWYANASYDVFSDKDVTSRFGLWAAHDIAALRSDLIAALEVGWGTEHAGDSSLLGSALRSELTTHAFYAGTQLRYVPLTWLQLHARLAAGAAFVGMGLDTTTPAQHFHDHGVSPFASLGLGCTLRTPTRLFEDGRGKLASLSLGLMLEGGYTVAAPLDFTADGPGPGQHDIALTDSKLGRLERSGPYARASIVVRF
jgi:hypothetical protein